MCHKSAAPVVELLGSLLRLRTKAVTFAGGGGYLCFSHEVKANVITVAS